MCSARRTLLETMNNNNFRSHGMASSKYVQLCTNCSQKGYPLLTTIATFERFELKYRYRVEVADDPSR